MRILHLVHQYPPDDVGGTELYTQSLARQLAKRGHEVAVFYRRRRAGRGDVSRQEDRVRIYVAWDGELSPARRFLATFYSPFLTRAFQNVIDAFHPDIVHIQHLMGLPLTVGERLQVQGIPHIVTLHDYWWICPNAQLITNDHQKICNGPRLYLNCARCALSRAQHSHFWPAIPGVAGVMAWRNLQLRHILTQARQIIAPSRFVRDWYIQHGISAMQITVIPHGIEEAFFRIPSRVSHHTGLRIACVGGLSWQKGVHILIKAFRQAHGNAELWIAGDESAYPAYVAKLRQLADHRVRFLGKLNRDQVLQLFRTIDILAVPSLWHETFSLITHEALAAGVPVLASRIGALREAITDGVNGFLLPPGDLNAWQLALQGLLNDPTQLTRLHPKVSSPKPVRWHVQQVEHLYSIIADM